MKITGIVAPRRFVGAEKFLRGAEGLAGDAG
jgi:hypothetical protein